MSYCYLLRCLRKSTVFVAIFLVWSAVLDNRLCLVDSDVLTTISTNIYYYTASYVSYTRIMIQKEFYCKIRFWLPQVSIVWDTRFTYNSYYMTCTIGTWRQSPVKGSSVCLRGCLYAVNKKPSSPLPKFTTSVQNLNIEMNNNTRLIMNKWYWSKRWIISPCTWLSWRQVRYQGMRNIFQRRDRLPTIYLLLPARRSVCRQIDRIQTSREVPAGSVR